MGGAHSPRALALERGEQRSACCSWVRLDGCHGPAAWVWFAGLHVRSGGPGGRRWAALIRFCQPNGFARLPEIAMLARPPATFPAPSQRAITGRRCSVRRLREPAGVALNGSAATEIAAMGALHPSQALFSLPPLATGRGPDVCVQDRRRTTHRRAPACNLQPSSPPGVGMLHHAGMCSACRAGMARRATRVSLAKAWPKGKRGTETVHYTPKWCLRALKRRQGC